jgi:thymidylate synthase (FAD)
MSIVKLIGLTKPSAITGCNTAAELVAYAARVSNPDNQNNKETAPRLLKYLIKNKHWSPFEMVSLTIEINTTRDISRQIIRHKSFSFQEFSQRYAEAPIEVEIREARLQDDKNRQNSIEVLDPVLQEDWSIRQRALLNSAHDTYNWALQKGIAKEQARAVLPEGNTTTTLFMSGTLRSWIHYCHLRGGNGTQKEHAEIAQKCWEIIETHFADVAEAVEWQE